MMWELIGIYVAIISLIIGAIFTMVGAIGMLKLDNPMSRLHAPTKVGTVGIGALLLASMIHSWVTADGSFNELLIMAFLFVTAPISANFIAKVYLHTNEDKTLPKPPRDDTWSTLNVPAADRDLIED